MFCEHITSKKKDVQSFAKKKLNYQKKVSENVKESDWNISRNNNIIISFSCILWYITRVTFVHYTWSIHLSIDRYMPHTHMDCTKYHMDSFRNIKNTSTWSDWRAGEVNKTNQVLPLKLPTISETKSKKERKIKIHRLIMWMCVAFSHLYKPAFCTEKIITRPK